MTDCICGRSLDQYQLSSKMGCIVAAHLSTGCVAAAHLATNSVIKTKLAGGFSKVSYVAGENETSPHQITCTGMAAGDEVVAVLVSGRHPGAGDLVGSGFVHSGHVAHL